MKNLPSEPDGPLGPWYQKVNAKIAEANHAQTLESLKQILGEPDSIEIVPDDERVCDTTGEVSSDYPDTYFEYADPYRPRFFYRFGMVEEVVIERGRVVRS